MNGEETVTSLNIKRGILSLFQLLHESGQRNEVIKVYKDEKIYFVTLLFQYMIILNKSLLVTVSFLSFIL